MPSLPFLLMSTRSQIEITNGEDQTLLYHHHDGYPEWLVPEFIQKAVKLLYEDLTNPGYLHMRHDPRRVASYFAEAHYESIREFNRSNKNHDRKVPLCSGFEQCDEHGLHGDIEWFYLFDLGMPERIPMGSLDDSDLEFPTRVFTPNEAYWTAEKLPDYISRGEELMDERGRLLITPDRVRQAGLLPERGEVYTNEVRDFQGNRVTYELRVLDVNDWLATGVANRYKVTGMEPLGTREVAALRLHEGTWLL